MAWYSSQLAKRFGTTLLGVLAAKYCLELTKPLFEGPPQPTVAEYLIPAQPYKSLEQILEEATYEPRSTH